MDCDNCQHDFKEKIDVRQRCETFCDQLSCKICPLEYNTAGNCPIYARRHIY